MIAANTYVESLTLNKAISLTGVSSATTIIRASSGERVLRITGAGIDNTVVISGLTFTGGRAGSTGSVCPAGCGGGIFIEGSARPRIENVTVTGNTAGFRGGGVYASTGSPLLLINSSFLSNTAKNQGGGLYAGDETTIIGGSFSNNSSDFGGGMFITDTLTLVDSNFFNNTAVFDGGGLYGYQEITINGGRFENNQSSGISGGGLWVRGLLILTGTKFINNTAGSSGGGLRAQSSVFLTNANFSGNSAVFDGGGAKISVLSFGETDQIGILATTIINGSRFENNHSATNTGGGLWVAGNLTVDSSSFIRNRALKEGGGLFMTNGPVAISNTIILSNTANRGGGLYQAGSGAAVINHSCIVDNWSFGIYNAGNLILMATKNWWGSSDGPSGAGPGSGDSVSSKVNFTNFLTTPILDCPFRSVISTYLPIIVKP
jgi:predicted outer membrane repeat protein